MSMWSRRYVVSAVALLATNAGPASCHSQGVTLRSPDGRATLVIPDGAPAVRAGVRLVPVDDRTDPAAVRASAYRIEPESFALGRRARVTIQYDSADTPSGAAPSSLGIALRHGESREPLASDGGDTPGEASAIVTHGGVVSVRWHAPRTPCKGTAYHALDFRIGTWDYRAAGFDPGRTTVERDASGCALHERFADATGGHAYAFFLYDERDRRWHATTYDPGGRSVETAEPAVGRMIFYHSATDREVYAPQPGGAVALSGERSSDGGQTWSAWFHALYTVAKPVK